MDVLQQGPGSGDEVNLHSSDTTWSNTIAATAAQNLLGVARALENHPLPLPST